MDETLIPDLIEEPAAAPSLGSRENAEAYPEEDDQLRGFRRRWLKRSMPEDGYDASIPSPSWGPSVAAAPVQVAPTRQPESRATSLDHTVSANSAFLTGMKASPIVLPWEQSWLTPIFGDPNALPSLSMPPNWSAQYADPVAGVLPGEAPPVFPPIVFELSRLVKNKVDRSYIEERSVQTGKAVAKLLCFLELGLKHSDVGRQIEMEDTEAGGKEVLLAILGTRSPGTVIKRVNSLLHFYRWACVEDVGDFLPFKEEIIWAYVRHLHTSNAAPTKATSFVQALRFSHYVLGVDGANLCITSRRVVGSAELQLATKEPTRQARALTVAEVKRLHSVTTCQTTDLQQKVMAIHLLLMLYTRSRTSDLAHVQEVLRDVSLSDQSSGGPEFIQISTRYHKSAKNVEKKNLLLPILASGTSVVEDAWLVTWLKLRRQAGLKVAGEFNGAIQPAPDLSKEGQWLRRPLTCSETTLMLRSLLGCQDKNLTSHSLKTTCLSWAAKAELPRDQRRLLGRHASSLQDADSVYARDLAFAPVKALQRVLILIKNGEFDPDQNRSNFFPAGNPLVPGTPAPVFQPGTPASLANVADREQEAPPSPGVRSSGPDDFSLVDAKSEAAEFREDVMEDSAPVVVSSSSDSPSSTSGSEDVESDGEQDDEVEAASPEAIVQEWDGEAFVKNTKTTTIHSVPDVGHLVTDSTYANSELLQRRTTRCGRMTSSGFTVVRFIEDWTLKCRICFKGRRQPPNFKPLR